MKGEVERKRLISTKLRKLKAIGSIRQYRDEDPVHVSLKLR